VYLSTVKVALIGRTDRRGRLLWSLPKGHIEDYETVPMTAIREVREETGIEGEIIKRLGTIDYWFLSDGKRIHKTVHHYLLRFTGGELSNADTEITEVKWVPLKDLPRVLSYADERKLARRAIGTVSAWIRHEYGTGGTVVTVGKDTSEKNTSGKERKNRDQNQNRNPKNRSQAGQKQAEQKQAGQPYKGHKDQQQKSQPQKDRRNQPRKDQSQKDQVQKEQTRQGQARRRRRRRGHRGRGRNGNSAPSS
jgi:hydrolase, NUDIX family